MSASEASLPVVLLLGKICHANEEWDALSAVDQFKQIKKEDRTQFLSDCESDVHDGVIAIARTYDSIEVLHLTSPDRRKRSTESKAYKTCVADRLLEDSTKSLLMLCPRA